LTLYLHTSVLPFGSFGQPDLVLVRDDAASSAAFLIMSQSAVCTVVGKRRNLLSVESGCCSNRERSKNCDEELLITGVSVSEENQRVLNDGVLASWMK
jgi:hypothetical protein